MAITNPQADVYGPENRHSNVSAQVNWAVTEDKYSFAPAMPIAIVRWGTINNSTTVVGSGKFTCDLRPTAGSDSSRVTGSIASGVDTQGGTLTMAATAAGKGNYHNLSQPMIVCPGQEVVFATSTGATSGTGFIWFEYAKLPFQGDSGLTSLQDANLIYNMTKVTA